MPELPEVETISRQLKKVLVGRVIEKVEVLRKKSFEENSEKLTNWKIADVRRKAKVIEILFDKQPEVVIVHLKMTGQLVFLDGNKRVVGGHPTADWVKTLPSKHTRVIWFFKDGSKLFFNDMRVFGWMKVVNREKYEKEISEGVPDIVDRAYSKEYLSGLVRKTSKPIKLLLLDQKKIGGLGNIYVCEALFLAGINPKRTAKSLDEDEVGKLFEASKKVIDLGIKYGGASSSNYVGVSGLGGSYQDHFLVYKREGEKCLKCGSNIRKIRMGGRGTFYCPGCQK